MISTTLGGVMAEVRLQAGTQEIVSVITPAPFLAADDGSPVWNWHGGLR